uniref:Uncharacterized protein n=1 Tax=Rhizophora mucronata TaxID=61149 RepID=A0A2P2NTV4_RHIMU
MWNIIFMDSSFKQGDKLYVLCLFVPFFPKQQSMNSTEGLLGHSSLLQLTQNFHYLFFLSQYIFLILN